MTKLVWLATSSFVLGMALTGCGVPEAQAPTGAVADFRSWTGSLGPMAPLVHALVYAVLVVFLMPGSALTLGAGAAFGLLQGWLVATVGSLVGASIAFGLARTALRSRVEPWVRRRPGFRAIDRALERGGGKIVALTRLSPVLPFNVLNYAYGVTGVPFGTYLLASWLAMIPGTLLYVWAGATALDLTREGTSGSVALKVVGLVATAGVVWWISRIARREIDRAAGTGPSDSPVESVPGGKHDAHVEPA